MLRLASRKSMESRVSTLKAQFADFQKEFKESRVEFAESRNEFRATHDLILQQLHSLSAKCNGSIGESSDATHSDLMRRTGVDPNLGNIPNRQENMPNTAIQRLPFLKMEFPRFADSDDHLSWIYKVDHYFEFFNIEDCKKVKMASFHFEREPLQWFQ
ncbi:hypothetical protein C1H46_013781 [Malus baccata]|uniref:Uncharacterized protein n=1 Tax=Malus baccata TaxID=106549 RepID=A0A540MP07_MALBA|nr:hypothetical protein C1H46_013781 [Malus baccata]